MDFMKGYAAVGGTPESLATAFERLAREMAPIQEGLEYERVWYAEVCGHEPPPIEVVGCFDGYRR